MSTYLQGVGGCKDAERSRVGDHCEVPARLAAAGIDPGSPLSAWGALMCLPLGQHSVQQGRPCCALERAGEYGQGAQGRICLLERQRGWLNSRHAVAPPLPHPPAALTLWMPCSHPGRASWCSPAWAPSVPQSGRCLCERGSVMGPG